MSYTSTVKFTLEKQELSKKQTLIGTWMGKVLKEDNLEKLIESIKEKSNGNTLCRYAGINSVITVSTIVDEYLNPIKENEARTREIDGDSYFILSKEFKIYPIIKAEDLSEYTNYKID